MNPNQLRAHLDPITDLEAVEAVTLVADVAPPPLAKLRGVVPPARVTRRWGRAAGKGVTTLRLALRDRPDWVLAYNLVPHGLTALLVGRLAGRRVLVHLIGGPREWEGAATPPTTRCWGGCRGPSRRSSGSSCGRSGAPTTSR